MLLAQAFLALKESAKELRSLRNLSTQILNRWTRGAIAVAWLTWYEVCATSKSNACAAELACAERRTHSEKSTHSPPKLEDTSEKLDGLGKKCQEQDGRIKQQREELAYNQKLLADNKKKDDQIIACGKADAALKAQVSALEKHLEETHDESKDQIEQLAEAETDATAGELKRLIAHHSETKEILANSQSKVGQLAELNAQLEGQIAVFDDKLAITEQELCQTQNYLAIQSQDLADSQNEVAQLTELKAQLEGQVTGTEQELSKTQQELGDSQSEVAQLTELKEQLEGQIADTEQELDTRSQELKDSQSKVGQLAELNAQLEGQIAVLDGKLAITELCQTQNYLAIQSQDLADSQNEVAQLTELKAQLKGELCMTQDELAMRSQELEKRCCSFEECVHQQQAASEEMQAQMHARISVLDRKLEGDALVSEHEARAHLLGNICEDYVIFENNLTSRI
jgi:chromosome segregation ATPase